jgi:divalent metal cation (Fe/Co/Zn/Cd) transporter
MRMRSAGPVVFVEVSVTISRVLPFVAVQRIVAESERAIIAEFPQAEVTVHWRPVRTAAETTFETLKMVAAEYGLMPHNLELSKMQDGKPALDYHLEFRPGTSLEEAVTTAGDIERTLQRELPEIGRFFSHLEEERLDQASPHVVEIESNKIPEMSHCANEASGEVLGVSGIHLFRDERDASLKLVLTAELRRGRSLKEAHEIVTEVEAALRERFPELTRILVQAEPANALTASTSLPAVQVEK